MSNFQPAMFPNPDPAGFLGAVLSDVPPPEPEQVHLTVVGDTGVGKTALVNRYVHNTFLEEYSADTGDLVPTVKEFRMGCRDYKITILDGSGDHRFRPTEVCNVLDAISSNFVIVYDVSNLDSFIHLGHWLEAIEEMLGKEKAHDCLLLGNKIDIGITERKVSNQAAEKWMDHNGFCHYFETSAKDDVNVKAAFDSFVTRVAKKKRKATQSGMCCFSIT